MLSLFPFTLSVLLIFIMTTMLFKSISVKKKKYASK